MEKVALSSTREFSGVMIIVEEPIGTINGINRLFTVSAPIQVQLFVIENGIFYPPDDTLNGFVFTNLGTIVTMNVAPHSTDTLLVVFDK